MSRLFVAIRKELRQFLRDRMVIALVVFIYSVDVFLCTLALSFDVKNLALGVLDYDRSPLSARLLDRFTATDYFGRVVRVGSEAETDRVLDAGRADLVLVVPPQFARDVAAGRPTELQLLLSGTNASTANIARGYASIIVQRFGHDLAEAALAQQGVAIPLPEIRESARIWYNPQLAFHHFMAISMTVVAALMIGVILTAASLVREKESGTAEQLMVTPLRPHEIVIAKMTPTLVVGMLGLIPSLLVARGFGVPVENGALGTFLLATVLTLVATMGIGVLVASFSANLQEALLASFFILFPLLFLSGTVVPIETMPRAIQILALASPIRYYMEIALGTLLKDVGIAILWPQLTMLAALATGLLGAGLLRLRAVSLS